MVDCVLALKLYYDWKHTRGQGLVKYGVNVKFPDGIKLPIKGSGKTSDSVNSSPVKNDQDQLKKSDLLGNIDISALLEYLCMKFPDALSAECKNKDFYLNCNGTVRRLQQLLIVLPLNFFFCKNVNFRRYFALMLLFQIISDVCKILKIDHNQKMNLFIAFVFRFYTQEVCKVISWLNTHHQGSKIHQQFQSPPKGV